jgi:succinoglycan biosynthesis protein ExoH
MVPAAIVRGNIVKSAQQTSDGIHLARIFCIFFMMYAHAPRPRVPPAPQPLSGVILESVASFLINTVSHASVPLLSVVSGWLLVNTYKGDSLALIRKKIGTLAVPLGLWNLIMLAVFGAGTLFLRMDWQFPNSLMGWLNGFFALADRPFNRPLYFLHDLLVCSIVGASILTVPRPMQRRLLWLATLAAGLVLAIVLPKSIVMQRAVILPSFLLGMGIAFGGYDVLSRRFVNIRIAAAAFAGLVLLGAVPTLAPEVLKIGALAEAVILVERLGFAIVGWFIIASLYAWTSPAILALERYTFFVFCSHFVLFLAVGAALARLVPPDNVAIYLVTFSSPVLAYAFGIAAYAVLERMAPWALGLLTGGRTHAHSHDIATAGPPVGTIGPPSTARSPG